MCFTKTSAVFCKNRRYVLQKHPIRYVKTDDTFCKNRVSVFTKHEACFYESLFLKRIIKTSSRLFNVYIQPSSHAKAN